MFTLKGRTMIITGGAGIVGMTIVGEAVKNGMNVAFMSRTPERGEQAVLSLLKIIGEEYKDQVAGYAQNPEAPHNEGKFPLGTTQADVLNWIYERFGSIDVVLNGSGGHERRNMEDTDKVFWNHSIEALEASFFNTKLAMPYLEKSKAPRVINLITCEGRNGGYDFCPAFAAGRGGIIPLTYAMARELSLKGITVNTVAIGPIEDGPIDDPNAGAFSDEKRKFVISQTPMGRLGLPKDVVPAILFFASEEAEFITGNVLDVNGGFIVG